MHEPHPTGASARELAAVAHLLAFTSFEHERPVPGWAKQKGSLFQVAQHLDPSPEQSLHSRIIETGFQPDRFINTLGAILEHHSTLAGSCSKKQDT